MFSVAVLEPGKIDIIEIDEPETGPYDVKVKTEAAALCNATDRKLIEGHFPGVNNYPLLLGHESVGTVVEIGEKVRNFKKGDKAIGGLIFNPADSHYNSGWGGFSEYTIIKDHEAMVGDGVADEEHGWSEVNQIQLPVKTTVPIEAAVLLCTWREVYGGLSDFNLKSNPDINNILIYGAGPVGLSFLKFLKILGKKFVGVVDPLTNKRKMALEMGADKAFAPDDKELMGINKNVGEKLDAVIDAVGNEKIINSSLSLIKMAGSICVYGVLDNSTVVLDKSSAPYNFNILFHQWPTREKEAAAQEPLVEWIKKDKLDYSEFITCEYPINKIEEAIKASNTGENLKILLRY